MCIIRMFNYTKTVVRYKNEWYVATTIDCGQPKFSEPNYISYKI